MSNRAKPKTKTSQRTRRKKTELQAVPPPQPPTIVPGLIIPYDLAQAIVQHLVTRGIYGEVAQLVDALVKLHPLPEDFELPEELKPPEAQEATS